jgi:mannose-1-phosphate guanylyltransferase/phosphomannomutase
MPVNVPDIVVDLANRIGIRIVRTKADFRSRMAALQKDGFHPVYDGIYTLVHLLRMMASEGKTLSELLTAIPQFALYQQIVECPWQEKGAVMRFLMDHTQNHRVELIDGIKIYHDDGWTLIRPDGDEPYVRILVQATSTDNAERWAVEYATVIQTYRSRMIAANRVIT